MDEDDNNLCCGCLSADRKMILIEEYWKKQCFLQIISEIPMSRPDDAPLWLCWQCSAHTQRFAKFKERVKSCYKRLHEFARENLNSLQTESTLKTVVAHNLTLGQDQHPVVAKETVKTEPYPLDPSASDAAEGAETGAEVKVKTENDEVSVTSERALSDLEESAVVQNGVRKKSKTKEKLKRKRLKNKKQPKEAVVYREISLSHLEIEAEREGARCKEEFVNAVHKCERCVLPFPNPDDLMEHTQLKHELHSSKFKCPICECSFASDVSYSYHANKHAKRYACAACGERFASARKATRHYETLHTDGRVYTCETCQHEFDNHAAYASHQSLHPLSPAAAPAFPCPHCDKRFRWATSLRKHAETHRIHTGLRRKPYCDTCRLSFTNTANLQKHVKTSSKHQIQLKLRKLSQSQSGGAATTDSPAPDIEQIKLSVNKSKQAYPCPQCDKKFQWKGNLLRHLQSHTARANGELVCNPCNRTFSSIATYNQHMKISRKHVSESEFKHMCSECGKRFSNKTRLKDHVNWDHLQNYVHTCDRCKKVFKSHTSLYLHKQVVHNKDNAEHLCDHCGKAFPNHTKLRSHIAALHTAESPYKCDTCGARFNWHSCLSRHIRVIHRQGKRPAAKKEVEVAS